MGGDIPVDSEAILVTDFMNLKIKSVQYFECAHRNSVYVCIFIYVSTRISILVEFCYGVYN
jgi:hypothetical protein